MWQPLVGNPTFDASESPLVYVDAAHGNYHTIESGFATFADLLEADGYRVESARSELSAETLRLADVFVIVNATRDGEAATWRLPTPPAFTHAEITALSDWVASGGSLLLIADHMPFPGSVADLADAFGLVFIDGYARQSLNVGGWMTFSQSDDKLMSHGITRGRNQDERVPHVKSFSGQAFRAVAPVEPLMLLPDDWVVFLPREAGEFDVTTPRVSARGLLQGAALHHGEGRVAVFGEAAMFTAQAFIREGNIVRVGMNDAGAEFNAQFALNVMHWLSGLIQ